MTKNKTRPLAAGFLLRYECKYKIKRVLGTSGLGRTRDSVQRRRACTVEPQTCQSCLRRRGPTAKRVRLCGSKEKGAGLFIMC